MSDQALQASMTTGPHSMLARLCGSWKGMTKTFFEPDILTDKSPWQGTISPILNGLFVQYNYSGSLQGKPLTGTAIFGYNIIANKYQCAWMDSFHNGTSMMFCEGLLNDTTVNVLGKYDAPDGSPPWGWRTTVEITTTDKIVVTMYNITPEGIEAKAVETIFQRIPGSP